MLHVNDKCLLRRIRLMNIQNSLPVYKGKTVYLFGLSEYVQRNSKMAIKWIRNILEL